jgi:3',5'-nucleoside bisphosphate phosphatase
MKKFRADLHVHSVLSPCSDLDMSPARIVSEARKKNIDILGITDHNSTLHCRLMMELGEEEGIFILPGVEINTKEEIHCLAFFENADITDEFQEFLNKNLPFVLNKKDSFGEQLVVDRNDTIIQEIDCLLVTALEADIYAVVKKVKSLGGIFIPAHIDRPYNSIISQLGFVPPDLQIDALEVSARNPVRAFKKLHPEFEHTTIITSSDAHFPDYLGRATTNFSIEEPSFKEIIMALHNQLHRKIITG